MKPIAALLLAAAAARAGAAPIAFVDVNLIAMQNEQVQAHQTVLVEDGRIAAAGPMESVAVPRGAQRIDGKGRYLMPGLVDAHVHLLSRAELPLFLAQGVTTVYNLSGHSAHLTWRRQVAGGSLLGPRIFTTGPIMNTSMPPAEAERFVQKIADQGYDGIKVYNKIGAEEYPVIIATAKARGLLITGHVARAPGFAKTLAAGQSLAHAEEILYSQFNDGGGESFDHVKLDESKIAPTAAQIKAAGISVTATLTTFHDIQLESTDLQTYLKRPEIAALAPWVRDGLAPGKNIYGHFSPNDQNFLREAMPFQRKLVKAMSDAGVPILTGTDAAMLGPVPGYSLHREFAELSESGLTPYQVLRAATVSPAAYFGKPGEDGTIAPGRRADLLLLQANPLDDVANTTKIEGVMAAGRWLPRKRLDQLTAALPAAHRATRDRLLAALIAKPESFPAMLEDEDPLGVMHGELRKSLQRKVGKQRAEAILSRVRAAAPNSDFAKS